MAVEIPVVVDIEGAFKDAAARTESAMKPLQSAIDGHQIVTKITIGNIDQTNDQLKQLNQWYHELEDADWSRVGEKLDLTPQINQAIMSLRSLEKEINEVQELRLSEGGSGDFSFAEEYHRLRDEIAGTMASIKALQSAQAQLNASFSDSGFTRYIRNLTETNDELLKMREYYSQLEDYSERYASSINAIRGRIAELSAEWNNMTRAERESSSGRNIVSRYRAERRELKTIALSLEEVLQKEERRQQLQMQGMQKRRYENAILNSTVKTMRVLQEQERILSERMNRTRVGSPAWEELRRKLHEVRAEMASLQNAAGSLSNTMQRQESVISRLTATLGAYVSVRALVRFAKQIRDVTGELEYQRVALGHLLQDTAKGNALFEQIKEAAIESPFRIKDLVTYTKQLAAYRIEQNELFDTTKRLADISAGLGVDMNRLILAFGQVRAAAVLRGQELRQFTESGIPLVELLADKFTDLKGEMVSTADVFKLISERAVPFSMIADIFEDLTSKGGMFYKMQEEQAKTLKGRWEKLKDAYDIALQSIGDTETFQNANDAIVNGLRWVADNLRIIVKLADAAAWSWGAYNAVLLLTTKRTAAVATAEQSAAIAEALRSKNVSGLIVKIMGQAAAEKALTAAQTQATIGTNALARALGRLKVALLTNPYLVAGAAILGLVLALTRFRKEANGAQEAMTNLNRAVDDMRAENKRHERVSKLIDKYEELSKVTERNAAQNETLARTTKKLSAEFPELRDNIDNANLSLEERLKLVKEMNEEEAKRLQQIKQEKEEDLRTAENKLKYAEQERDALVEQRKAAREAYNEAAEADQAMQEKGKTRRKGFWGFLFGQNYASNVHNAAVAARQSLDALDEQYDKAANNVENLTNTIADLKYELYGTTKAQEESVSEWKKQLEKMQVTAGGIQLFTPQQLEGWHRLYDVSKDLEKEWQKLVTEQKALEAGYQDALKSGKNATDWKKDLDNITDRIKGLELIREFFHFIWGKQPSSRDTRLSQLKSDISELTNAYKKFQELRKYKGKEEALIDIDKLFPQLKGWEPTLDKVIKRLQGKLDEVRDKLKRSPKDKTLLDMQRALETEISNLKFDALKNGIEDQLKRLSDEIKRSEAARNFYKDIFDLTGDQTLSVSLTAEVYGNIGSDFKDRLQQQLNAVLSNISADADLTDAFKAQNFKYILDHLSEIPEKWHKEIKDLADAQQKFSADQIKTWLNELKKAKTYADQRIELARKTQERIAEINSAKNLTDEEKQDFSERYRRREREEASKLRYEAFKGSPLYVQMFGDLESASESMLRTMRENITEMMDQWKELSPTELKEMQRSLLEIDSQLAKKNPFRTLSESIEHYNKLIAQGRSRQGDVDRMVAADKEQKAADKNLEEKTKELAVARNLQRVAKDTYSVNSLEYTIATNNVKNAEDALKQAKKRSETARKAADQTAREAAEWDAVAKNIDAATAELEQYLSVFKKAGDTVSDALELLVGDDAADFGRQVTELFETLESSIKQIATAAAKAAGDDISGAFQAAASGVLLFVDAGIKVAKMIETANLKKWTDQMEEQDRVVRRLERSYSKLEKAMAASFGSDYIYNYNEALEVLYAKQEAYIKEAEIQAEKAANASGKANREAAAEQEKEMREEANKVGDEIEELREKMQEFYAGTSLTAAAEEFANAWLDAYRQFGNTADAIKGKMEDMINNLIVKSSLAKAAEAVLSPFFTALEEAAKTETLTAELPNLIDLLGKTTGELNETLTLTAQVLRSSGINLRSTVGNLSGISRDIATASEESILALAAGINTQNFYMSYMPTISTDVKQIAEILSVGTGQATSQIAPPEGAVMPSIQEMLYQDMPVIKSHLANIERMLGRVIVNGTSTGWYVATKL